MESNKRGKRDSRLWDTSEYAVQLDKGSIEQNQAADTNISIQSCILDPEIGITSLNPILERNG